MEQNEKDFEMSQEKISYQDAARIMSEQELCKAEQWADEVSSEAWKQKTLFWHYLGCVPGDPLPKGPDPDHIQSIRDERARRDNGGTQDRTLIAKFVRVLGRERFELTHPGALHD